MRLSSKPLIVMQTIEYMRAFLLGRIGLSSGNLVLIISGAFGVFNTARVVQVGGYRTNTIGEDMELVVRLHRINIEKKWAGKIAYCAEPVCYTEVPEGLDDLRKQRIRWHRGLFESLWTHRKMVLNAKYGGIGLVAMPFFTIVELLGPMVEMAGYILVTTGIALDSSRYPASFWLLITMVLYGSIISMGAVLLEEWRLGKYRRVKELNQLLLYALSESFWFRPLLTYWRVIALVNIMARQKSSWGEQKRVGISS